MTSIEFVDHYEVLELSPNATSVTIERVFRYLAKQLHPDANPDADTAQFTRLVEAYETLRDPEARAAYDISYERQKQVNAEIVQGANAASDDCNDRHKLLSVLYSQRRRDHRKPGIGLGTLESLVPFPPEVLQFHLWYFREKGWIAPRGKRPAFDHGRWRRPDRSDPSSRVVESAEARKPNWTAG